MKRYEALQLLAASIAEDTIVVANVGPISREWNALRPSEANLLQVNLGLCSAVGLGIAKSLPHRKIVLLDGDGNLLMNLASLADAANQLPLNLVHIVLDNGAYEGGGGLPSVTSKRTDLALVALGAGIEHSRTVDALEDFDVATREAQGSPGHWFIAAKVDTGSVPDLPTQTMDGPEAKYRFARYIESSEGIQVLRPRYTHI
ncbi:MAG: thiamine pyrophosphate-dependent enzyme [Chloroflexi bacterium]|nr:thiamine pyrophosphate-dependent enzyme [Chloroflexota bacterium]MDA1174037.1 thiamine pyrophosphate-dependent enzyme [Chloroflexota bacterium]